MTWNWQKKEWPHFRYDRGALEAKEATFLKTSGFLLGMQAHLKEEEKKLLIVHLMREEAYKTSEIEGEYLSRDSLQMSLRRHFHLEPSLVSVPPAERGISDIMIDLYENFDVSLTHTHLFSWHTWLTQHRPDLIDKGRYRTHLDPMQVISGSFAKRRIHFEAPPSADVPEQMEHFMKWFNQTAGVGDNPLPCLIRAGIAHLYFVCIHPFEDGNGRIGRALAEKALAQNLGYPPLLALSQTLAQSRKTYYDMLSANNQELEITPWLIYFAQVVLEAQAEARHLVHFVIQKAKFYEYYRDQLNPRQERVIARLFQEGPQGFKGGLSADNYMRITRATRATATRDLQNLVHLGALRRTGERKGTRYALNLES